MITHVSTVDFLIVLQLLTSIISQAFEMLDSFYLGDYSLLDYFLGFLVLYITFDFFDRMSGIQRLGSFSRGKKGDDTDE